jgi:hypothetical protein
VQQIYLTHGFAEILKHWWWKNIQKQQRRSVCKYLQLKERFDEKAKIGNIVAEEETCRMFLSRQQSVVD